MTPNPPPENRAALILGLLRGECTTDSVATALGWPEAEVRALAESVELPGTAAPAPRGRSTLPAGWVRTALFWSPVPLAIGTVLFFSAAAYFDYHASSGWSERGQRADFWGGHIAAAGSFAGTFLFFLAIMLQHEELKQTRAEMQESRGVAEAQLAMAKQSTTFAQVMDLLRLSLEAEVRITRAEIAQGGKGVEEEAFVARDQYTRLRKVLDVVLSRAELSADVKSSLKLLSTGEDPEE